MEVAEVLLEFLAFKGLLFLFLSPRNFLIWVLTRSWNSFLVMFQVVLCFYFLNLLRVLQSPVLQVQNGPPFVDSTLLIVLVVIRVRVIPLSLALRLRIFLVKFLSLVFRLSSLIFQPILVIFLGTGLFGDGLQDLQLLYVLNDVSHGLVERLEIDADHTHMVLRRYHLSQDIN